MKFLSPITKPLLFSNFKKIIVENNQIFIIEQALYKIKKSCYSLNRNLITEEAGMKSRFRKISIIPNPFRPLCCLTCDCIITAGTSKCPNCENNPYVPPESYSQDEWQSRNRNALTRIKEKFHAIIDTR